MSDRHAVAEWLTPAERTAVDELVAAARAVLGPRLRAARLLGSRARGEGSPDHGGGVADQPPVP